MSSALFNALCNRDSQVIHTWAQDANIPMGGSIMCDRNSQQTSLRERKEWLTLKAVMENIQTTHNTNYTNNKPEFSFLVQQTVNKNVLVKLYFTI